MDLHVCHLQVRVPTRRPRNVALLPDDLVCHVELAAGLLGVERLRLVGGLNIAHVVWRDFDGARVHALRLHFEADNSVEITTHVLYRIECISKQCDFCLICFSTTTT